jgi:hypothetical protein
MNSSSGIRTHSIAVSETTWSASCLPSHIHAGAQSEIRTHNHSILSRVALPAGVSRRGNGMIPDGLEPSFSGCKPGVVATGPRDLLRNAIAIAFERLTMTDELLFKIGANLWQSVEGGQLLLEYSQHLRLRFMSSRILISEIAVSMKCKAST